MSAELGRGDVGEDVAGEDQRAHDRTEGTRHPDPVAEGEGRIAQGLAEPDLQIVVVGVVPVTVQLLQRGPVALVEDEEGPVLEHLVDELVEQAGPGLGSPLGLVDGAEGGLAELVKTQVQRHQDVLFAGEVVVDGRLGEAQPLGDLTQRGALVALFGEELEGDVEDPLPRAHVPGGVVDFRCGHTHPPFYLTTGK